MSLYRHISIKDLDPTFKEPYMSVQMLCENAPCIYKRVLYIFKEPYPFVTKFHIPVKEPHVSGKETHVSVKESCISVKEPYHFIKNSLHLLKHLVRVCPLPPPPPLLSFLCTLSISADRTSPLSLSLSLSPPATSCILNYAPPCTHAHIHTRTRTHTFTHTLVCILAWSCTPHTPLGRRGWGGHVYLGQQGLCLRVCSCSHTYICMYIDLYIPTYICAYSSFAARALYVCMLL